MSIVSQLAQGLRAVKSIFTGLSITGRTMVKPWETVLYPMAQAENLDSYRGHIELVGRDADPAKPRCIGCGACMAACPSSCIDVECAQDPRELTAPQSPPVQEHMTALVPMAKFGVLPQYFTPSRWILEYSTCSLCGQCVRACPAGAIRFSNHIYFVARTRPEMRLDLLARLNSQARRAHEARTAAWDSQGQGAAGDGANGPGGMAAPETTGEAIPKEAL